MDTLFIPNLSTKTRIGVHAWEQRIEQVLLFDIELSLDLSLCNDQLENTLDYEQLCQMVTHYVESNSFKLIETVAEQVAALIKAQFRLIHALRISVSKPHAISNAGPIKVTLQR